MRRALCVCANLPITGVTCPVTDRLLFIVRSRMFTNKIPGIFSIRLDRSTGVCPQNQFQLIFRGQSSDILVMKKDVVLVFI